MGTNSFLTLNIGINTLTDAFFYQSVRRVLFFFHRSKQWIIGYQSGSPYLDLILLIINVWPMFYIAYTQKYGYTKITI